METKKELWERLENEPERAYRAFECYLSLPSHERTVIEAYRVHVGNPEALKPSDTWTRWSRDFAWRERAAAYNAHLDRIRRTGIEKAIEEEAAEQARQAERVRGRLNEMMAAGFEESMRWFEEAGHDGMRASDVIAIIRVHLEHVDKFGSSDELRREADWEEDDAEIDRIIKEVEGEGDEEDSENTESDPD